MIVIFINKFFNFFISKTLNVTDQGNFYEFNLSNTINTTNYKIYTNDIAGHIDKVIKNENFFFFEGWAANLNEKQSTFFFILLDNNQIIYNAKTNILREDLIFQNIVSVDQKSGFKLKIIANKEFDICRLKFLSLQNNHLAKIHNKYCPD